MPPRGSTELLLCGHAWPAAFTVSAYIAVMTPSPWTAADLPDLRGRTAIVTGANSGIGRVAALELAHAGAAVTLAVRDTAKGQAAAATMTGNVTVRPLDLADLVSVREFAHATEGPVDLLVDNAGIMATPQGRTADGFELQIGTNHLGHFALTNLLLLQITNRVVVVSSSLHTSGRIDLDDLNWQRRSYKPWAAYSQSKLANLLFALELQRRLTQAGSAGRATAPHPRSPATPPAPGRLGGPGHRRPPRLRRHQPAGAHQQPDHQLLHGHRQPPGRAKRHHGGTADHLRRHRGHPGRHLHRPRRIPAPEIGRAHV